MTEQAHGPECWREPAHHGCATAAMARAEGERDEARRQLAEAHQRLAGREAVLTEITANLAFGKVRLQRVEALLAEYQSDLETKGEDWHPRFRSAVVAVIDQLGHALQGGADVTIATPAESE